MLHLSPTTTTIYNHGQLISQSFYLIFLPIVFLGFTLRSVGVEDCSCGTLCTSCTGSVIRGTRWLTNAKHRPAVTKLGITRWFHKLKKNSYIKNSIYLGLLVHRQEYRDEQISVCETTYWYPPSLFQDASSRAITIISTIHRPAG
jgi:hypothetical protein